MLDRLTDASENAEQPAGIAEAHLSLAACLIGAFKSLDAVDRLHDHVVRILMEQGHDRAVAAARVNETIEVTGGSSVFEEVEQLGDVARLGRHDAPLRIAVMV